ncbi:hypothetical protein LTR17_022023, partial [Elasticomyces elasticus]
MPTTPPVTPATTNTAAMPRTGAPSKTRPTAKAAVTPEEHTDTDNGHGSKVGPTTLPPINTTTSTTDAKHAKIAGTDETLSLISPLTETHIGADQFSAGLIIPRDTMEEMQELGWFFDAMDETDRYFVIRKTVVFKDMVEVPFQNPPFPLTLKALCPGEAKADVAQTDAEKLFYSKNIFV